MINIFKNEKYKDIEERLKECNVEKISLFAVNEEHLPSIIDSFENTYSMFPCLKEISIKELSTEAINFKERNNLARFNFNFEYDKEKNSLLLVKKMYLASRYFKNSLDESFKIMKNNKCHIFCGEEISAQQFTSISIAHELAHSLVRTIYFDKIKNNQERINLFKSNKDEFYKVLKDEMDEMMTDIYNEAAKKLEIKNGSFYDFLVQSDVKALLSDYAAKDAEECFAEAFGDFIASPCPSRLSVEILNAFKNKYPEYVNIDVFQERLNEINNNYKEMDSKMKAMRIERLNYRRGLNYETGNAYDRLAKKIYSEFCAYGTLEGRKDMEIDTLLIFRKGMSFAECSKSFSDFDYGVINDIILKHPLFEDSSNEAKKVFLTGFQEWYKKTNNALNNENINEMGDKLNSSDALNACCNILENFSDIELFKKTFPLEKSRPDEDQRINWEAGEEFFVNNQNKYSQNDFELLFQNIAPIIEDIPPETNNKPIIYMAQKIISNHKEDEQLY